MGIHANTCANCEYIVPHHQCALVLQVVVPTGNKKKRTVQVIVHALYHWHNMILLPPVIGTANGILLG